MLFRLRRESARGLTLVCRTPKFSFETLTAWWNTKVPHQVARVFAYWINRVEMDVELLEEAEVISQTRCAQLVLSRKKTNTYATVQ